MTRHNLTLPRPRLLSRNRFVTALFVPSGARRGLRMNQISTKSVRAADDFDSTIKRERWLQRVFRARGFSYCTYNMLSLERYPPWTISLAHVTKAWRRP